MERYLWLNLTGIKEKDKAFLLDALILLSGLFGDRYQEAKLQSVVFKERIPHCVQEESAASTSHA